MATIEVKQVFHMKEGSDETSYDNASYIQVLQEALKKECLINKEEREGTLMAIIEVKQVLRMKEGTDETSYVKTSYIQKQVLLLTKSIKEKAIKELYYKERPEILCIADLGCSSAELNTLSVVSELIETVEKARRELGNRKQEYQVYLNDLPGNDFNTIFRSLTKFTDHLKLQMGDGFGHCFVNGVPGSFYGRLFPSNHH